MLLNIALFSHLLLVPAVLGVPSVLGARVARRREGRQSQLNSRIEQAARAVSDTRYSGDWAGAAWDKGNGTFTSVTGTFTVPTTSGSTGATAAAWVGIDGDTCPAGGILSAGVDLNVSSNGQPKYGAWHRWFPAPPYEFSDMTVSVGDVIKLTVNASSMTSGIVTIENLTTDKTVSKSLTSNASLCGQNAEWIVENDGTSPLADFGTVTFTNALAAGNGTYTPSGATIYDIRQNHTVLTSTSINGSSVTIKYV